MTATFDKLKALLETQKSLSNEDVAAAIAANGEMTDDEKMWLESEKHKLERDQHVTITMDEYLAAANILDTTDPDSDAYKEAEIIVEKFESGM